MNGVAKKAIETLGDMRLSAYSITLAFGLLGGALWVGYDIGNRWIAQEGQRIEINRRWLAAEDQRLNNIERLTRAVENSDSNEAARHEVSMKTLQALQQAIEKEK